MMKIPMMLLSEDGWRQLFEKHGFGEVRLTRCYDERPVASSLPPDEQAEQREFREKIGALAISGVRVRFHRSVRARCLSWSSNRGGCKTLSDPCRLGQQRKGP